MHYHYLKVLLFWVSSSCFWSLVYLFKEVRDGFKQAVKVRSSSADKCRNCFQVSVTWFSLLIVHLSILHGFFYDNIALRHQLVRWQSRIYWCRLFTAWNVYGQSKQVDKGREVKQLPHGSQRGRNILNFHSVLSHRLKWVCKAGSPPVHTADESDCM